jgi:uncharacterized membrane protein
MRTLVTIAFIVIVLLAIFPFIMKWVLWGLAAAVVIFIFIKAPREKG